jgi:glutathionylspermidine synthase
MTIITKEPISFIDNNYVPSWNDLERTCIKNGFTWAALWENEEWNQYITPSLYEMPIVQWNNIQIATKNISNVFQTAFQYLQWYPECFQDLQIPDGLRPLMTIKQNLFSYFARIDLIVDGEDIKLLEINSDTPVGMVEASIGNALICSEHGTNSPNFLEEGAIRSWEKIIDEMSIPSEEIIYFASYEWHDEDTKTVQWMKNKCPHPYKDFVDIDSLVVNKEGIFAPNGNPIRFLYRLYPLEFLLEEAYGNQMIEHLKNGMIQFINPPASFLTQVKSLYAWIWQQYEENSDVFSQEERKIIEKHFLPTYHTPRYFIKSQSSYVAKPIFGREGGGIEIVMFGEESEKDETEYYVSQPKIYQKYREMPDVTVGTWDGPYTGKMLVGSHFMGGEPCGLFLRAGEKITGNLSMFFGISIKK